MDGPSTLDSNEAERIRSLRDDDYVFQAFDAYPWSKDDKFLSGLTAILGPADSSQGSAIDMATHARVFYYAQKIGVQIDFAKYKDWLDKHPDHRPPQVLPEEFLSPSAGQSQSLLPWQKAAPKADLFVDRKAAATKSFEEEDGGQPNYPMAFAEMLKLLQDGHEIPGIRHIPNTIARDHCAKPVGTRAAPKKPWEEVVGQSIAPDSDMPTTLDAEFPALD